MIGCLSVLITTANYYEIVSLYTHTDACFCWFH